MIPKLLIVAAISAVCVWTQPASAQWKEGLWEITTKVEMPGMPKDMPATTVRQCITRKDMTPMPTSRSGDTECKRKDQKISGDTVTYAMECSSKDGSTVESAGSMTFKGDAFTGSSVTTMKAKGQQPMKMTGKMTGKYLGPCTK